jgi:hypothetical protein
MASDAGNFGSSAPNESEDRSYLMGYAAAGCGSMACLILYLIGLFAGIAKTPGHAAFISSGDIILAMSLLVGSAMLTSILLMLRSTSEFNKLQDEIDQTNATLDRAQTTAARIRHFRTEAAAQNTYL